ncbi:MAG: TSUP family transporter [Cyanobacteria bacterium J06638_20]
METINYPLEVLLFLFGIATVAGFIDTLAGGGGLLTIPALIISGIPPLAALGTNKLQGSMGTATASYMMFKYKRVRWAIVAQPMMCAFAGSLIGTIAVQYIDTSVLIFVIPLVLFGIALYFLLSPNLHEDNRTPVISQQQYQAYVIPAIGGYDGMFGPGTGSFLALAGVSLRGQGIIDATAIAKTLNLATNLASLIVFFLVGQIVWIVGGLMLCGQLIGASIGSRCLVMINPKHLRMLIVVMSVAMLIRYFLA